MELSPAPNGPWRHNPLIDNSQVFSLALRSAESAGNNIAYDIACCLVGVIEFSYRRPDARILENVPEVMDSKR
ncbi:hypothetical protein L3C95_08605 [Chitinophaga filiformis]|uniref:hypothetical protein n=1 Tax=Chitinophaga filiformis TaxID=104663 RepID=UPI001F20C233|nr:hypothetical protein [Chitinophaga filiformis]MCF6402930.1 hypothetical protein [Chitinophaga filiformis]